MGKKPVAAGKSSFDLIDPSKFFSNIEISPDAQIADLACGVGRYSIAIEKLLNEKGRIHAIDLWDEGIETLKKTIKEKGISKIKPAITDITKQIPLDTESIDFCLLATILHDLSIDEQDATLKEIVRILKPRGVLAIIEFKKNDQKPGPTRKIRISELEAEEKIKKYGLIKLYCGEIGASNYLLTCQKKR